jgi:hypothetical protein
MPGHEAASKLGDPALSVYVPDSSKPHQQAQRLLLLGEQPLRPAELKSDFIAFRILYDPSLPSRSVVATRVIRIEQVGPAGLAVAKGISECEDHMQCCTFAGASRPVAPQELTSIARCFERAGFWQMPSVGTPPTTIDSVVMLIEAVRGPRHHWIKLPDFGYTPELRPCVELMKSVAPDVFAQ